MAYNDIKLFKLTDTNNNIIYYGHTKSNLSRKLAEMKYLYKLTLNCNKFKSVFDKYGIDNIRIGLVDAMSFNDIDNLNKKIDELSQTNINTSQPKTQINIQPTEQIQIQPTEQIQMTQHEQPNITYNKPKKTEHRGVINANTPKKSFADIIKQIGSN